jgi:peroxiredoxin
MAEEPAAGPLPGHSYHGEAFNEGPRQAAYLMGGTGRVEFPVTTTNPQAQAFFTQGVGQLHGFWYFEAERSFRQAAMLDPDCAMAYWGLAQANVENRERAGKFIAEAVKRKESATPKERKWIDAAAAYFSSDGDEQSRRRQYVEALEALVREFPDDLEPKAFLALQIYKNGEHGIPVASRQAVESLIQAVLRQEPLHPIHHYRIHIWDPGEAAVALSSAARCGQAAPSIAHMWHMPGHIYSKVQRYADAVWQQEASARVDHAHMIRDRVLPDQIHNYAHNNEWLIRNLNYLGRVRPAVDLAKNMIELPRHPKYNTLSVDRGASAKFGRERLLETLVRWELWPELLALADTVYLEPSDVPAERVRRLRAVGVAAFSSGDRERGKKALGELVAQSLSAADSRQAKVDEAEAKARADGEPEDKISKAKQEAGRAVDDERRAIDEALVELRGLESLAVGDLPAARDYFTKLAGVSKERQAAYFLQAGDLDRAEGLSREAADESANEVQPLARRVEVLEQRGKTTEAEEAFRKLRTVAAHAELDAPILERLAPVARRMGLPEDWRLPAPSADDVGQRPDLASLGPFRWHPSPAAAWTLPDSQGQPVSLAEYRGRPVVVIFYLGFGCLHCVEQLQAFSPLAQQFRDAGIDLVAISSEPVERLREGLAKHSPAGEFPIRLLSDPELAVFRAYRAYDDFEHQPLHGTLLIDGQGLVRWQDISFEPFKDAPFLLGEARRLLDQNLRSSVDQAARPAAGRGG